MSNPYPGYKSNVVYTLPEPQYHHYYHPSNDAPDYIKCVAWNETQMQAAFAAGAASRDAEIEALRNSLNKANSNHEEFERKWYLVCDEIEALWSRVKALDAAMEGETP